jgi:hypothetical protein
MPWLPPTISIHIDVGQCLMAIALILNAVEPWLS